VIIAIIKRLNRNYFTVIYYVTTQITNQMETQHLVEQIHAYKASDLKMCLMYEDLHN